MPREEKGRHSERETSTAQSSFAKNGLKFGSTSFFGVASALEILKLLKIIRNLAIWQFDKAVYCRSIHPSLRCVLSSQSVFNVESDRG